MKRTLLLFTVLSTIVLLGCKGDQGADGLPGVNGIDGKDGNANVQSRIITVYPTEWVGDYDGYYAEVSVPTITQNIHNTGVVLCYLKLGDYYMAMPFSYYSGEGYNILYSFMHAVGKVEFAYQDDDGYTFQPTQNVVFKVVTIASSELQGKANVNFENYDEVAEAFGLK